MPDNIFAGLFDTPVTESIAVGDFLICVFVAIILGVLLAAAFSVKARFTKSFLTTVALIPAIVCVVIMMVNGKIGAGIAVAGAFSLVRFRSAPGTAREIAAIFMAMCAGLICGMGYIAFAVLFTLILGGLFALYNILDLGASRRMAVRKSIRITIPEDLDYTTVFDDLFAEYTKECHLVRVKTTNMGSMFRITYDVLLRDAKREKEFIDRLRERNGNLEIMVSREETAPTEL